MGLIPRRPGRPTWPGTGGRWRFRCGPTRASARCAGTRARAAWEVPCTDARDGGDARRCWRAGWCWRPASTARAQWEIPAMVRDALPRAPVRPHRARRSTSRRCAGKRVAVLGAGASAFDNAATALEQGAREVALCLPTAAPGQRQRLPLGGVRRLPAPPRRSPRRRQVALHPPDPAHGAAPARATPASARARTRASTCTPAARWTRARAATATAVMIRRQRRGPRGRLRDRRDRLRHRSRACAPSCARSSRTSRAGRTAISRRPASEPRRSRCVTPTSAPASSSPSGCRARRPTSRYLYNYTFGGLPEPRLRRGQHLGHEVLDAAPGRRHHAARSSSRIARRTSTACGASRRAEFLTAVERVALTSARSRPGAAPARAVGAAPGQLSPRDRARRRRRIGAVLAGDALPPERARTRPRPRRPGDRPRARRLPRPHQRARAHRVGGVRDRHPRGRRRAASPRWSTCRSTACP